MRLRHSQPAAPAGRPFTLIELLTVMLIAGIMLAITVPVVVKITSGSSVEAASRMIGAQLRLARQEAIVKRRRVAVLFPKVNSTIADTSPTAFLSFRACYVEYSGGKHSFQDWVPGTTWAYVPIGAVVAEVDNDGGPESSEPEPDLDDDGYSLDEGDEMTLVTSVPGFADDVRAIVFLSSGRSFPSDQMRNVTIVEGAMPPNSTTPTIKARANWINISVNCYTGRVAYQRPEDED